MDERKVVDVFTSKEIGEDGSYVFIRTYVLYDDNTWEDVTMIL